MKIRRVSSERAAKNPFSLPAIETESWLKPHPRFRLQKILVPVDFSEPSEKALQYALSIAQEFGSEIILVHVVAPYPVLPEMGAAAENITQATLDNATAQLNRLKQRVKDVPCTFKALLGSSAHEIVEFANREKIDLIILGTKARTGFAHAILGSVAERVVRLASCPTLVVRAQERDFLVVHADDAEANRSHTETAAAP